MDAMTKGQRNLLLFLLGYFICADQICGIKQF